MPVESRPSLPYSFFNFHFNVVFFVRIRSSKRSLSIINVVINDSVLESAFRDVVPYCLVRMLGHMKSLLSLKVIVWRGVTSCSKKIRQEVAPKLWLTIHKPTRCNIPDRVILLKWFDLKSLSFMKYWLILKVICVFNISIITWARIRQIQNRTSNWNSTEGRPNVNQRWFTAC
jgi:hypothetical protein